MQPVPAELSDRLQAADAALAARIACGDAAALAPGETTYRLVNVKRGEPPADLFKVPADVKVRGGSRK